MTATGEITLGGTAFAVQPGSYHRRSSGPAEGRVGRVTVSDFAGGQRRAFAFERDTSWDSAGVGPGLGAQVVEPWPWTAPWTDGVLGVVSAGTRVAQLVAGDALYLGIGRYLYRSVSLSASSWGNVTLVADMGAGRTITGLAPYGAMIAIATGSAIDIQLYNRTTGALSTLSAGLKGGQVAGYANRVIAADPTAGNEAILRLTTGGGIDTRELDAPIVNMTLHGGRVAIATRAGLWLLGGRGDPATGKWTAEPEPFFSHGSYAEGEDFRFLASFGGKLYTWLAGGVMEWNPNAGASRQGWRATGLEGRACHGGTVAGNHLVASIESRTGRQQLWAFEGSGWWLMHEREGPAFAWPAWTAGAGKIDLVAFRDGDTGVTCDRYRTVYRDATAHNLGAAGAFTTALLDAGDPDRDKHWRRVGASFAAPDVRGNPASTDPVTIALRWSVDGGATWSTAATATLADPTARVLDLVGDLPDVSGRYLQLQVTWASVSDWAPPLAATWAEYETDERYARRRRWSLTVPARDGEVTRSGGRVGRTGSATLAALWTAWESATPVPFTDIDYDLDPVTRTVRIAAIHECPPKPADGGRWGAALVDLELVEV